MKVNIEAIKLLVDDKFNGNITLFSQKVGISRSLASQVINQSIEPKSKFICGLIQYCEKNDLDFKKYIFFDNADKILNNNSHKDVVEPA